MTESEIILKITELEDKATAASMDCIHYMDKDNPQIKKYLVALREHGEATREINRLKKLLNEIHENNQKQ